MAHHIFPEWNSSLSPQKYVECLQKSGAINIVVGNESWEVGDTVEFQNIQTRGVLIRKVSIQEAIQSRIAMGLSEMFAKAHSKGYDFEVVYD